MFSPQGSPGPTLPAQVPAPSQKGEKFAPNWFEQRRAVTCQCPRWLWPGASHRWSKGWENQHPAALHPQVGCCCQPQEGTQIQGELFGFLWVFFFPLALAHRAAVFPDTFPPEHKSHAGRGASLSHPPPAASSKCTAPPSPWVHQTGGGGGHTQSQAPVPAALPLMGAQEGSDGSLAGVEVASSGCSPCTWPSSIPHCHSSLLLAPLATMPSPDISGDCVPGESLARGSTGHRQGWQGWRETRGNGEPAGRTDQARQMELRFQHCCLRAQERVAPHCSGTALQPPTWVRRGQRGCI